MISTDVLLKRLGVLHVENTCLHENTVHLITDVLPHFHCFIRKILLTLFVIVDGAYNEEQNGTPI